MLSFIYVMYDELQKSIIRIFIFKNDNVACRTLKSFLYTPNSPFVLNIEDMSLYKVAVIDEETRQMKGVENEQSEVKEFKRIVADYISSKQQEKKNKEQI